MSGVWTPIVLAELRRHGLEAGPGDTPAGLRQRLNELYVQAIRKLKARRRSGDFPAREYADRVRALKEDYPLLGLPLDQWRS